MITRIYFWKIQSRDIPWAIAKMALDRRPLRRDAAVGFWKLLGTGKGETFTPRDADANRWGLLITIDPAQLERFENSPFMRAWDNRATETFRATLQTIAVQGSWSGKRPFQVEAVAKEWGGQVAAITRARIKNRKSVLFWRSVPPVTDALHSAPGLIAAIGIGEAPIGLQGTFSIWRDSGAIREFAYRGAAHQAVIAATSREAWYAEELFARFVVVEPKGHL